MRSLRVKALQAYTRDVGRTFARIDPLYIEDLGLTPGEFLEIHGSSTTGAKCLPLYPSDLDREIVRMDGLLRQNAGISLGEWVEIRRASVTSAKRIVITPLGASDEHTDETTTLIKHSQQKEEPLESKFATEMLSGTPVANGDFLMIDYHLSKVLFLLLEKEPASGISVVSKTTHIDLVPWIVA